MASLFTDEKRVLEQTVEDDQPLEEMNEIEFNKYFEIEGIAEEILKAGCTRVALQFPDHMLGASSKVIRYIEQQLKSKGCTLQILLFVIADTSYGSCCVDDVTASHNNAEFLVHFGHSCLSRNDKLGVKYVFGNESLDIHNLKLQLDNLFESEEALKLHEQRIVVLCEPKYYESLQKLNEIWNNDRVALIIPRLDTDHSVNNATTTTTTNETTVFGRIFNDSNQIDELQQKFLWIGNSECKTLINFMMKYNKAIVYTYNVDEKKIVLENKSINKTLMRRYFLVQKAKDAEVIGIVVGTLGVVHYRDIIQKVKEIIQRNDKKYYTIVVGKMNEAKLANFAEIPVFVLISCSEMATNWDFRGSHQIVVTPFELFTALEGEWTGEYTTEYLSLLNKQNTEKETRNSLEKEQDEVRYSLVDQKIYANSRNESIDTSKKNELIIHNSARELIEAMSPYGAAVMQRSWKGLEPKVGETEPSLAVEGRKGIASEYEGEGHS